MKKINLLILVTVAVIAVSCKGNGGDSSNEDKAVCVWDNVSLKDSPGETGKWLCGISIGETLEYLGKKEENETGKKKVSYIKVKLKDGKEGWVQNDFAIINSKAAAIVENAEVYSRPNLLNKTGNFFSMLDIVAVKSEKDGFVEVVGKRRDGKWIETGWIKSKSVTYADVDIAVAKFASKALIISDLDKRNQAISEILNNPDFSASVFIATLPQPEAEDYEVVADTTSVK